MKNGYNLLIIGFFNSVYIKNLVKNLKKENPHAHIYFFGDRDDTSKDAEQEYTECYDEIFLYENKRRTEKIPIVRGIEFIFRYRKSFNNFIKNKKIDIVNIHYVMDIYVFLLDLMKRYSHRLVVSPWGSDVFYVSSRTRRMLRLLYGKADFITGKPESDFAKVTMEKFSFSASKYYSDIECGSEAIDYILSHKDLIDINNAKKQLGIDGNYVITCGYKGEPGQQHLAIIDAINNVKAQLPSNLLLLFPFTYGGSTEYRSSVKKKVEESSLKAVFFEEFVDMSKLFLMRQATDLYIHTLIDDAGGASLKEYLTCEKKAVVGGWLHFADLSKDKELPYFTTDNMQQLDEAILKAYNSPSPVYGNNTRETLLRKGWSKAIKLWNNFYCKIA